MPADFPSSPSPGELAGTVRKALLAGATGLVGRALLAVLQVSPHYAQTDVLVRRAAAAGAVADASTRFHEVDFAQLPVPLPVVDDVFIALGTTIKVAGSRAAFRAVDFDYVVDTARAARAVGATRVSVVSALGANASSAVFYNRVKGEMQEAVAALGFESTVFAQPSLLVGDRAAIGQPARTAEVIATRLLAPAMWLVPRRLRPITATRVAAALVAATVEARPGVRMLSSSQMQA